MGRWIEQRDARAQDLARTRDEDDDRLRSAVRRLVRLAAILCFVALTVILAQWLVLESQIAAARINFKSLIVEYEVHGPERFRRSLVAALRADQFHVAPEEIRIDEDPSSGTARISLRHTRRVRILVFPYERTVSFARDAALVDL